MWPLFVRYFLPLPELTGQDPGDLAALDEVEDLLGQVDLDPGAAAGALEHGLLRGLERGQRLRPDAAVGAQALDLLERHHGAAEAERRACRRSRRCSSPARSAGVCTALTSYVAGLGVGFGVGLMVVGTTDGGLGRGDDLGNRDRRPAAAGAGWPAAAVAVARRGEQGQHDEGGGQAGQAGGADTDTLGGGAFPRETPIAVEDCAEPITVKLPVDGSGQGSANGDIAATWVRRAEPARRRLPGDRFDLDHVAGERQPADLRGEQGGGRSSASPPRPRRQGEQQRPGEQVPQPAGGVLVRLPPSAAARASAPARVASQMPMKVRTIRSPSRRPPGEQHRDERAGLEGQLQRRLEQPCLEPK